MAVREGLQQRRVAAVSRVRIPWHLAAFILPAAVVYTVFMTLPLILSLRVSLYQGLGLNPSEFVGIGNFIKLLTEAPFNTRFFNALWNNTKFFLSLMVIQNAVALFFALILSSNLRGRGVFRTIMFMPTTLSVVIVGFLWTLILNPTWGIVNQTLKAAHLQALALPWLGLKSTALGAVAAVTAWQYVGIPLMLFAAGIQAIPDELVEAARIDGGTNWQVFRRVLLPLLWPVIGIVTILTFVSNFTAFDIIYAMATTLAQPDYGTDILGSLFYRTAFGSWSGVTVQDMGLGGAIAATMFLVIAAGVTIWYVYGRSREGVLY